jgi:hypothetical protein
MFLHLIGPDGQIFSQMDSLPQQGLAPTTSWIEGEIIQDEVRLSLPETMPDSFKLVVGWYNINTGERLITGSADIVVLMER